MYRLDRKTLEVELSVRLNTALRENKSSFASKNREIVDKAYEAVVDAVLDVVDGRGVCVVRADDVKMPNEWPCTGTFGEHEPWPAPIDAERHPVPKR